MYNTREKLTELLADDIGCYGTLGIESCDTCSYRDNANCYTTAVVEHLIANGVTVQEWIPMADEKPKRRGNYFIAYKFKGSDMIFFGEAMWHDDIPDNGYVKGDHFSNEGVDGMYVTHWMKIPRLPAPKSPERERDNTDG